MSKPIFGMKPTSWAKHLKPRDKRRFWDSVRETYKRKIKQEASELQIMTSLEHELFKDL